MKTVKTALILLTLAGCGNPDVAIEGMMAAEMDVPQVWVDDGPGPVAVEDGAFRLEGVQGDTVVLIFGGGDRDEHRMRLIGATGVGNIALHGIWLDQGLAFPASVDIEDGRVIDVNRLRFGPLAEDEEAMEVRGELLAIDRAAERALLRPTDQEHPEVRLLISEGTAVRSIDGDVMEAGRLEAGDTVEVRGVVDSGYLRASELVLARRGPPARRGNREGRRRGDRDD